MARTAQIALGDLAFTAQALTLRQYDEIADHVETMGAGRTQRERMTGARAIVLSAWNRAEGASRTDDDMLDLVATPLDLLKAANTILGLAGIDMRKGPAPGEGEAGETPAP